MNYIIKALFSALILSAIVIGILGALGLSISNMALHGSFVFAILTVFFVYDAWKKIREENRRKRELEEEMQREEDFANKMRELQLGAINEVTQNIDGFFNDKTNQIASFIFIDTGKHLRIFRFLHEMSTKEVIALKTAFLLHNNGYVDNADLTGLIKPIVLNSGECYATNQDGNSANKGFIMGLTSVTASSESAVARIFDIINKEGLSKDFFNQMGTGNRWFSGGDFYDDSQISPYMRTPDSLFLGIMSVGNGEATKTFYTGERSLIDIAPPGSGKTQCHMLINLRKSPCSAIVLDIKGECHDDTAKHRKKFIGSDVYRFAPEDPKNSHCYNPLSFVSKDEDEVWEQSHFLAEMLSPLSNTADKSWELDGQSLLTLTIAYVVLEKDNPTMADVLDIVSGAELEEMLEDILDNKSKYPRAMFRTATSHSNTYDKSEQQWQGVQKAANQHLQVWEGAKMEKVSRKTDWTPEDFRKPGTTLYLCIPPNAIETYASALRVIIGQHVRHLMADGQMEAFKKTGYPIIFYLDELPRLGSMEPIREALDVGRSYGLKLWLITQYTQQLEKAYPCLSEGMMDSCGVQIYMNPGDKDAQNISQRLGKQENVLDGKERAMVEPHELTGPEYKDDMVVFVNGEKPARLHKVFDYEIEWPKEPPETNKLEENTTQKKAA